MPSMSSAFVLRPSTHKPIQRRTTTYRHNSTLPRVVRAEMSKHNDMDTFQGTLPRFVARILGASAAAIVLATSPPAVAELSTVPADQVTQMAKPLKQQPVNKNKIWILFILGATSLFGTTILLENNDKWFPAISRANKAMAQAKARMEAPSPPPPPPPSPEDFAQIEALQQDPIEDTRTELAVLDGLEEARRKQGVAKPAAQAPLGEEDNPVRGRDEDEDEENASFRNKDSEAQFPRQLSMVGDDEAVAMESESGTHGSESSQLQRSEDDGDELVSTSNNGAAAATPAEQEQRAPVFEINSEQIQASMQAKERDALGQVSLEELQRELEARKAAMSGKSNSGSE